jgi:hydrogenase nickel incorporation protein HypA/HybF
VHELGLCDGIAEAIVRRAKGRPVSWARVRIGGHAVDPAVIEQGVAIATLGTEAEGVELEVAVDPLRSRCRGCGAEEDVADAPSLVACRACGSVDVEVRGTEHAVLEALAYRSTVETRREMTWTRSSS